MSKHRLFSITASDCDWDVFRGSGDGGQKRQKTSSGVRCTHRDSGAVGKATDSRFQAQNRKLAFERMVESPEFQSWLQLKIEAAKGNVEIDYTDDSGRKVNRKVGMEEV